MDDFHGSLDGVQVTTDKALPTSAWNDLMAQTEKLLMDCSEVMRQEIDMEKRRALKEKLYQLQNHYDSLKQLANRFKVRILKYVPTYLITQVPTCFF